MYSPSYGEAPSSGGHSGSTTSVPYSTSESYPRNDPDCPNLAIYSKFSLNSTSTQPPGLEGLDTETISETEDGQAFDEGSPREEGEIVEPQRNTPSPWSSPVPTMVYFFFNFIENL